MRLALGSVLLALALIGCGGDGGTEPDDSESDAEGSWAGAITGGAQVGSLEWTLQDTDGDISGNGSFSTTTDAVALTIEGTYSPPNLTLTIHSKAFEDMSFSGTVGPESMKGRLNGSGFLNRAVTLDRQ